MAFWDQEINKLKGFGSYGAVTKKPVIAPKIQLPTMTGDPRAVAASIPPDVKRPTDVVLPPSRGSQTQSLLASVAQVLQQAKAKTAEVRQITSKVKSLKGFFGFGAVNLSPADKARAASDAKRAASDAKLTLTSLKQTKTALVQHRQNLLKDKAQITNEKAKVSAAIAKKVKHKGIVDSSMAKIPKTVTKK